MSIIDSTSAKFVIDIQKNNFTVLPITGAVDQSDEIDGVSEMDLSALDEHTPDNSLLPLEDVCDSGASTVPLTAPLRNMQHYFQLSDDVYPPTTSSVRTSKVQSQFSDVSTDVSFLSATPTYYPDLNMPSTSSSHRDTSIRRKSSPTLQRRFDSNCLPISSGMSSYLSPIETPSPFVVSLLNGIPEPDFQRPYSFRFQPRKDEGKVSELPSFKFQLPELSHHYISPMSNKYCPNSSTVSEISPPLTPDTPRFSDTNTHRVTGNHSAYLTFPGTSYVNQSLLNECSSRNPPDSNKATPEATNPLVHEMSPKPRRTNSLESVIRNGYQSDSYIDMSPNNLNSNKNKRQTTPDRFNHSESSPLTNGDESRGSVDLLNRIIDSGGEQSHCLSEVSDASLMTSESTLDFDATLSTC